MNRASNTEPHTGYRFPSRQNLALFAFLVVALMGAGAAIGIMWAVPELERTADKTRTLEVEAARLGGQLEAARARAAVSSREAEVMREANSLLREQEQVNQERISALESDLELYRRLGGATGTQRPLAVRHAELITAADGTPQLLSLTLTQNLLWANDIEGWVDIRLLGQTDGKPASVGWSELAPGVSQPSFAFKYFQLLELPISIPADFEPGSLEVTLKTGGVPFVDRFAWDALLPPETIDEVASSD